MQRTKRYRVFTYAIAISLAKHCIAAIGLINVHRVEAAPEQRPTNVSIAHIATPPPPTPTPPPATAPPRAPRTPVRTNASHPSHVAVVAPHVSGARTAGGPVQSYVPTAGGGNGDALATAMPQATPKPSCSSPNVAARVIDAVPADTPDDVGQVQATVQVEVTLDTMGRVADASIYKSANDGRLDRAALIAAKRSTYAAAIVDCVPHSGSYLFVVDFAS